MITEDVISTKEEQFRTSVGPLMERVALLCAEQEIPMVCSFLVQDAQHALYARGEQGFSWDQYQAHMLLKPSEQPKQVPEWWIGEQTSK
jgi:hypothetical protein